LKLVEICRSQGSSSKFVLQKAGYFPQVKMFTVFLCDFASDKQLQQRINEFKDGMVD